VIESAKIEGFRAIRSAAFTLEPLTFFLGPNGSGKTSILHALDNSRAVQRSDHWRHQSQKPLIELFFRSGGLFQLLRLDLDRMRAPNQLARAVRLAPNGDNLTNVFDSLTRRERDALASQFCQLIPTFSDVDRIATSQGMHQLRFQDAWSMDTWYLPHEVSDGSILVLAFLLLQYQQAQADVVAIEEPERGLHPYLLEQLVQLFRDLSTGKLGGKPVQFLLATHSPQLVEFARPSEVRFVDRDPKTGDVTVRAPPTEDEHWEAAFAEYKRSLGAVWLSGNLGGVPGA